MSPEASEKGRRNLPGWLQTPESGLLVAILAMIGLIYAADPGPFALFQTQVPRSFFTTYNAQSLAHYTALYGFLAVGVSVVIIAGGIDLSIGAVVALTAVVAAKLMTDWLPNIGNATPTVAGILGASGVTLLLWVLLHLWETKIAKIVQGGAIPAAAIACGIGLATGPKNVGTIITAIGGFLGLVGLVILLSRGNDRRLGSSVAAIVWGLAMSSTIVQFESASAPIAQVSMVVAASGLAGLVCLTVGFRWTAIALALVVAGVSVWGLLAYENGPPASAPQGLEVANAPVNPRPADTGTNSPEVSPANIPIGGVVAAVVLALLLGLAIGVLHAFLINSFRLPPFIATLASLAGLRSLARILSENRAISLSDPKFRYPGNQYEITVLLFFLVAAILSIVMGRTVLGRHLYALGGNESAARLSGLPNQRLKTIAYATSGLLAAVGGLLLFGFSGSAGPAMGETYELYAITAAVVGGCSLAGGVGSIRGTVLGLILIQVVIKGTGLVVEQIDPSQVQGLVLGIVVVLAVGFNQRFRLPR